MARASPPPRSAATSATSRTRSRATSAAQGDFGIVEDYTGHGIGSAMHQPPNVPNYGRPGRGVRLVEGLALAVEPMVVAGEPWTARRRRRLDRRAPTTARWPRTSSTPSRSPRTGTWVLTALDGGEARLAELGVPFGGRLSRRSRDHAGAADQPAARPGGLGPGRRPAPRAPATPVTVPRLAGPVRPAGDVLAGLPRRSSRRRAAGAGAAQQRRAVRRRAGRRTPGGAGGLRRRGPPVAEPDRPRRARRLRAHLDGLADDDGLLPPWTGGGRTQAIARCSRTPGPGRRRSASSAGCRSATSPTPYGAGAAAGWEAPAGAAYLAFGDTYAEERAERRAAGLAGRRRCAGEHLHQLVDPAAVAEAVSAARACSGRD